MHLFKFTLLGLVRDDQYIEAYSMKDLASGETKFISDWNSSRNSSSSNEDDNKAEREEKLNEEKLANDRKNQEDIKKCMLDINKSLKKLTFKEESVFNDCPCVFFEDTSFWGYRLELRENKDNEWYYRITALLNFKGWQGPYTSKDDMLKSVCENDFK
jgi:hypothetical protein